MAVRQNIEYVVVGRMKNLPPFFLTFDSFRGDPQWVLDYRLAKRYDTHREASEVSHDLKDANPPSIQNFFDVTVESVMPLETVH